MIRASAPYASGLGSFVLLKMDHVRVARGGSLSMLHRTEFYWPLYGVYYGCKKFQRCKTVCSCEIKAQDCPIKFLKHKKVFFINLV